MFGMKKEGWRAREREQSKGQEIFRRRNFKAGGGECSLVGVGELYCKQRGRARPGTSLSAPSYEEKVVVAQHNQPTTEHHMKKGKKKYRKLE